MKLAFIVPTDYLNHFGNQGDFYLALAHLIDDNGKNAYASFHRREAERGKRIILDNGLFEGSQVEPEALIHKARLVKAQTVCAPDVLYNSRRTVKAFKQFIRLKQEEGLVAKIMGIPQADNPADWWECFQFMQLSEDCDIIGLSILSIPKSFGRIAKGTKKRPIEASRVHLIRQLFAFQNLFGHRIKCCHLLGLGEDYSAIHTANRLLPRTIISNDSSSCFVHGSRGIKYGKQGSIPNGKIREKLDFNITKGKVSEEYLDAIQHNISVAKKIASS